MSLLLQQAIKGIFLMIIFESNQYPFKIQLIDTGLDTMTGGRIKRLKHILEDDSFMLTYGDGLCNVDIEKLIQFHKNHKKLVTITAVRPLARFGALIIDNNNSVKSFKEKSQMEEGWINGGFFVMRKEFIDLIDSDQSILEKEPLEKATTLNQMMAYKHEGFWQCMDHYTDKKNLEDLYSSDKAPWIKK